MKISGVNNLFGQFSADVTEKESILIKINGTEVLEAMKDGIPISNIKKFVVDKCF